MSKHTASQLLKLTAALPPRVCAAGRQSFGSATGSEPESPPQISSVVSPLLPERRCCYEACR